MIATEPLEGKKKEKKRKERKQEKRERKGKSVYILQHHLFPHQG
jgi:hypothetical protein